MVRRGMISASFFSNDSFAAAFKSPAKQGLRKAPVLFNKTRL